MISTLLTPVNNKYHHGDLKAALISAAESLIQEKGIDALSLRSIAAEVGVSHMAPYSHFKNKSELFQAVAASGFTQLSNRMQSIKQANTSPKKLILLYGVEYINFACSNPQLYKLMLSQAQPAVSEDKDTSNSHSDIPESDLIKSSKRPYALLKGEFARLQSDQHMLKIQAQGGWAMVHGLASLMIEGHIFIDEKSSIIDFLSIASRSLKTTR